MKNLIEKKRLELSISQRELSRYLGVSITYLRDILKGERNIARIDLFNKITEILNFTQKEKSYFLQQHVKDKTRCELTNYYIECLELKIRILERRGLL